MSIGLFYGSTNGNTKRVAEMIVKEWGEDIDVHSVEDLDPDTLEEYDTLILGCPTYGQGSLQEHWADFIWDMEDADLDGKTVALFGLGDQVEYPGSFVDAIGEIYEKAKELGAKFVGFWPTEGYEFKKSRAIVDDKFCGLVVDTDQQNDQTADRVARWVEQVKSELG